jgi:hypothetical protein
MKNKKANITGNFKFNTVSCPMSKINVINNTGSALTLVLVGPATYTFNLGGGANKITVIKGTYEFTGYASCGTDTGTIKTKGNLRWTWWCW